MIFRYGNYSHADNEVTVDYQQQSVYSTRAARHLTRRTMTIEGKKHGTDVTDLTNELNLLILAYATDNRDAVLFDNLGNRTAHLMLTSLALGGVKVVKPPTFGTVVVGEYTTWRNFSITLEGDFLALVENVLAFQETITSTGTGGQRNVFLETISGLPQKQTVASRTVTSAIQTGSAVGVLSYPVPASPLFPAAEDQDQRVIERRSPLSLLGFKTEFGVQWTYKYRAAGVPLIGLPQS